MANKMDFDELYAREMQEQLQPIQKKVWHTINNSPGKKTAKAFTSISLFKYAAILALGIGLGWLIHQPKEQPIVTQNIVLPVEKPTSSVVGTPTAPTQSGLPTPPPDIIAGTKKGQKQMEQRHTLTNNKREKIHFTEDSISISAVPQVASHRQELPPTQNVSIPTNYIHVNDINNHINYPTPVEHKRFAKKIDQLLNYNSINQSAAITISDIKLSLK